MNRNSPENNNNKSGYRVRRSSMTRKEAEKKTVTPRQGTTAASGQTRRLPNASVTSPSAPKQPSPPPRRQASARVGQTSKGKSAAPRQSLMTRMEQTAAKKPQRRLKNDFIKPTDVVRIKGSYDRLFLVFVIILTLFGIIMDFSASYPYAFSRYGDSFYFVKNQALYALGGIVIMFLIAHLIDYRLLRKLTIPVYIGMLGLLVVVLVSGVASGVAQRWIVVGPITIQPSEFMKPALVLMLALYVARNQDRITNYRNFKQSSMYGMFIPFLIVLIPCFLVMLEKHFSGTIIIFAIGMVIIFCAGARKFWFVLIGAGAIVALVLLILLVPYARERVMMLFNADDYEITGKIWQTMQGLYAIGSGGLFGVGLGNSRQKHLYVSQPQNDFIFSIVCEELGFAGALLVIILFMLLIWRGFVIALKAPDTFSSLVAIGLISKVAIQALLNIAVVTNIIPNTGISLPFFSYGGTALVTQLAEMGVVLSISRYSYQRDYDE